MSGLRWFGNVLRITGDSIHKKTLHAKKEGKRSRGRPRTRWIDQIRNDIEEDGGRRRNKRKKERD